MTGKKNAPNSLKMEIKITPVQTRKDLKIFIHLPAKIHKDHLNWVPPIYMDEWQFFNPHKNEAFSHAETILLLAEKDGEIVGRVMGIINHLYNETHNILEARFCFLETFDDFEVADALVKAVQEWAAAKGMISLVGPVGFSDKDPQGFMIEGFDKPVVIATNCNFPYMIDFMDRMSFTKKVDLVVYKVNVPETIPEVYKKINERIMLNNPGIKVVSFSSKRKIIPYVKPILNLVNETFKDIYGFAPLSDKEKNEFASRYLPILDPRFLKVIENDKKEVVAFVLGMPDISEGIKKCKGYVLPFGIFQILHSQKKTKQLDLLLGAVHPDYRDMGLNAVMGLHILQEAQKRKIEYLDSHLELEDNLKMRAENERLGGVVYKRFRIFEKPLNE
jgi:GNAT superfamily N-acetyltransferase